jgi:endonuclease-3
MSFPAVLDSGLIPLLTANLGFGVSDQLMPAVTNKQRQLNQFFNVLKKGQDANESVSLPVLEQFIYGICREGTSRDRADRAYRSLRAQFYDWNEVRVSSVHELEEALIDLPEPEARGARLVSFLQEVFEAKFSFDLDVLLKKGLKEAAKQLAKYQAANDYVVGWVVQHSLGGHAIPLDLPTLRTARRLGLLDCDPDDLETSRSNLEHLIPKARGPLFSDLISRLAAEVCLEEDPRCGSCPLSGECPSAQDSQRDSLVPSTRGNRPKPR